MEPPESNDKLDGLKSRVKFKIMSLKVKGDMDYVPELFDEHRDQVAVEQILRVILFYFFKKKRKKETRKVLHCIAWFSHN